MDGFAAYVGLDWGQKQHAVDVEGADGEHWSKIVEQSPEAIRLFVDQLRERYGDRPVAVAIEQGRGAVMYALLQYEQLHLMPVNPRATARYRESLRLSGAKSDGPDAAMLRQFVQKHPGTVGVWKPDDEITRQLRLLAEGRRKMVDQSTALSQQLREALLAYFPQALEWAGELKSPMAGSFLQKWPTLEALQRARPDTIRDFYRKAGSRSASKIEKRIEQIRTALPLTRDQAIVEALSLIAVNLVAQIRTTEESIASLDQRIALLWSTHPDRAIFESFPGAGPALAPRLAVAFGLDRNRWSDAASLQKYSGIAPVIQQSGKHFTVHTRWQCPRFIRQSFHEFAGQSIKYSDWARAFYDKQRRAGAGHHAAVRALAFRWIRVMHRCWIDEKPYDEARYIEALRRRQSPLKDLIAA